jgi:hypothetical protein
MGFGFADGDGDGDVNGHVSSVGWGLSLNRAGAV